MSLHTLCCPQISSLKKFVEKLENTLKSLCNPRIRGLLSYIQVCDDHNQSEQMIAGGPEQQRHAGRPWLFLWRQQPVQQPGEHDHHCFNQSLLVRQAGCGESRGESVHWFCILFSNNAYTTSRSSLIYYLFVYDCVFQTEYARLEGGRCVYRIHRSPMCEYMINFIHKLKHLPEKYMMNSVLENFTILQVTHV